MGTITETIWVKHEFKKEDKLDLAQKMAGAEAAISRKAEELKSVTATIKADMATQEGILHSCAEKLRSGYEMVPRECVVTMIRVRLPIQMVILAKSCNLDQ